MNKVIKANWVEALRSGKYEQGRGALKRIDQTYCCLGVLCDILGAEWNMPELMPQTNLGIRMYYLASKEETECLTNLAGIPDRFIKDAKLTSINLERLISMNDTDKLPFKIIAEYIEKEL